MNDPAACELLEFWFGPRPLEPAAVPGRNQTWFGADPGFDRQLERRFMSLVIAARGGILEHWAADNEDCLALILLLDQLPRNLYRGQSQAFDSDGDALALARSLAASGRLAQLGYCESAFALMPYQHSEDLQTQEQGVALYREQAQNAPGEWREIMRDYCRYAEQHLHIIERFGRFPHRNAVLGRSDTEEELQWLREGGARFGQ